MDPMRLDANESAFFTRELEHVKARSYDTKYKPRKAFTLLPISTEAASGSESVTYRKYTGVGIARIVSDYANDFPRVDVYGEEVTVKNHGVGTSFGYSIKEIRNSRMTGKNLDARRAQFARQANDDKINAIAWSGDASHNIVGFIDATGITEYTVPNDGTGTTKTWTTKTPDQIIRDLAGLVSAIITPTNGVEAPDTVLLPIAQYQYIANTRMSDGNDKTILRYFLDNNPYIKTIDWLPELAGAGASSTNRMMAYSRDEMHVTLEIPQMFEQFAPQQENMEFKVPCYSETAGVIVYYPLAVAYGDGI